MSAAAGGGVDVLAVLDEFALYVRNVSSRHALQGDITQARAAVAELIAAVGDVYGDSDREPCKTPCPSCRIRAALSNIEGASHG